MNDEIKTLGLTLQKSVRTLVLGMLGLSKTGKTTCIAGLTENPREILDLSADNSLEDSGRTKTTVQYEFREAPDGNGISITKIELFPPYSYGGYNQDEYNKILNSPAGKALNKLFKPNELKRQQDGEKIIIPDIKKLFDNLTETKGSDYETIKALLSTEYVDKIVKRITISVAPSQAFAEALKENKVKLVIRDTRGFLDITTQDIKNQVTHSLSDLGLDELDGVVFCCSPEYQNIVQDLYNEILKNVLKSIPVFLLKKYDGLKGMYDTISLHETVSVEKFVERIRDRTYSISNINALFNPTFKFLNSLNITYRPADKGAFQFVDSYFKNEEIEFLLPLSADIEDHTDEYDDLDFYCQVCVANCKKMVEMMVNLHNAISKLKPMLAPYLRDEADKNRDNLKLDFDKYDEPYQGYCGTSYVRPQFSYVIKDQLDAQINSNSAVLGGRGGITTQEHGKYRYPTTAVAAVTSFRWLFNLIDNINPDSIKAVLLKDGVRINDKLVKKALHYYLYRGFTDTGANIQNYPIINRYEVEKAILKWRADNITNITPFVDSVVLVLEKFCDFLLTPDDNDNASAIMRSDR